MARDIDDLPRLDANYMALTPLWFLERAATVHPTRTAVVHGSVHYTWEQTYQRCRRLASALSRRNIGAGSTVAIIAPNVPALYEAHFGVPMAGAVLNTVNIRLNASTIAFLLGHSKSAILMVDQEFFSLAENALKILAENDNHYNPPLLIVISDKSCRPESLKDALGKGAIEYDKFLESGDPEFAWKPPEDEWQSIALGYTSGTTASPKGVRFDILIVLLPSIAEVEGHSQGSLFGHCQPRCDSLLRCTCGAQHNSKCSKRRDYPSLTPRRPCEYSWCCPTPSLLFAMSEKGFHVTHTYGLSETYGPSTVCAWKPEWDLLPPIEQARLRARQGVRYTGLEGLDVVDPKTMKPVPADGEAMGEIVMRGNLVMKGYLKNPEANKEAFANGWFHSGDLAVKHPDGYIEIKDRNKDIIISGGENISSLEVENVLYTHPAVYEVSVVAREDELWGESPCAFVTLKPGTEKSNEGRLAEDIIKFCRSKMPAYWVPKSVVFGPLPKTATGKIQKHVLRAKAREMGPVKKSKL
ncbi:hypothetical protein GH714_039850 [Hevea brasiliensis]|uniref:AMP-dependent synthetase/ligase domain-containing protein n=1 Tax=Hevea brasiliensis TaxID=3981 RepID=A0A6A6MJQ2_HEVBR|nr:hypothetical protein GH714_039850 [Hevea brasiliensis]